MTYREQDEVRALREKVRELEERLATALGPPTSRPHVAYGAPCPACGSKDIELVSCGFLWLDWTHRIYVPATKRHPAHFKRKCVCGCKCTEAMKSPLKGYDLSDEQVEDCHDCMLRLVNEYGSISAAAKACGMPPSAFGSYYHGKVRPGRTVFERALGALKAWGLPTPNPSLQAFERIIGHMNKDNKRYPEYEADEALVRASLSRP